MIKKHQPSSASGGTKWGSAVTGGQNGYQLLPTVLLRNQGKLGLNPTDMVVLINILAHWWEREPEKWPHPRPEQIARRMDASPRTVQRSISQLSKLGLLKLLPSEKLPGGPAIRRYELSGLLYKLQALAEATQITH